MRTSNSPIHKNMTHVFSDELIKKFKAVFEKRAKRTISDDEAEIYLHKLGDIGHIAQEIYSQDQKKSKK